MGLAIYFRSRHVRITGLLVLLFCVLALLRLSQNPHAVSRPQWLRGPLVSSPSFLSSTHKEDKYCKKFPDPGTIAIALKTGATESAEKIPMLMQTPIRCAQSLIIYSDLEQEIAGYKLHNSLVDVPESAMEGNVEYDLYKKLKEVQKYGQDEGLLRNMHNPTTNDLSAWALDKYKQLHILEKLYAAHPHKDWYLMLDADTYLVWPNLLAWLTELAPAASTKRYLGSQAWLGDTPFAHGGSGIVISQAAMYDFAVTNKGLAAKWDKEMQKWCCGDAAIGAEMKRNNITLQNVWPTLNGEKPATVPYGPTHWCQPVVTMHHMQPHEVNRLAIFEQARNNTQTPLTFAELYHHFVGPVLRDTLADWDNDSKDTKISVGTYEECKKSCEDSQECFQFMHHGDTCVLGNSIHLGVPKLPENDVQFRSGWLTDRIKTWVAAQSPCVPKFPELVPLLQSTG